MRYTVRYRSQLYGLVCLIRPFLHDQPDSAKTKCVTDTANRPTLCPPGDGRGSAPPVLSMLGYGNLGALANDPRVNPRAWQDGNDVGATHEQPNCAVSLRVTVSFR